MGRRPSADPKVVIAFRVPKSAVGAIEEAASTENRTLSEFVCGLVLDGMARR